MWEKFGIVKLIYYFYIGKAGQTSLEKKKE